MYEGGTKVISEDFIPSRESGVGSTVLKRIREPHNGGIYTCRHVPFVLQPLQPHIKETNAASIGTEV
jgi:hypothetical protein